jgi:hypothetical protein
MNDRIRVVDDKAYLNKLADTLNEKKIFCKGEIKAGKTLPEKLRQPRESNYFGGNMEGFPGGLCLVGDTLPEESFNDFCKNRPENAVKLSASWLSVGHIDEAVSIVSDPKSKPPCNYAVLRASPQKALGLLSSTLAKPQLAKSKFLELNEGDKNTALGLCGAYESLEEIRSRKRSTPSIEDGGSKATKGAFRFQISDLISSAHAGATPTAGSKPTNGCGDLSNQEALEAIQYDHKLYDFNMLVEEEMLKAEKEIKAKSAANGCPNIKIIPVPNLFKGNVISDLIASDEVITAKLIDGTVLKKKRADFTEDEMNLIPRQDRIGLFKMKIEPRTGRAINPNPTNSVLLNGTIIFPEQKNELFKSYLEKNVAQALDLKSDFVNTWQSAHANDGNLHCSTNTFRYCRPVTRSSKP